MFDTGGVFAARFPLGGMRESRGGCCHCCKVTRDTIFMCIGPSSCAMSVEDRSLWRRSREFGLRKMEGEAHAKQNRNEKGACNRFT